MTFADDHAEVDVCVTSEGRLLVLLDRSAPLPRAGSLDVRTDGLWVSLTEEDPGRWSLGLEGFALEVGSVDEELGVPTPLGLDVEYDEGTLHGELLTDLGAEPVDAPATWAVTS